MKNIIQDKNSIQPPRLGEVVEGNVVGTGKSAVYLDLGPIGTGIIYGREFKEAKTILKDLKIGEKVLAKVVGLENEEGFVELSLREANQEVTWKKIEELKEKEEPITVSILGANKGGLLTQVFKVPAFLPVSQLSPENYPRIEDRDPGKILKELQKFLGKEMKVRVLDFSAKENKLILSEKAESGEKIKDALKYYNVQDIVEGEITAVLNFGVFIKFKKDDFPVLEGLIHISELDWKLIEDPNEIVKIGQNVKAKIINIEKDRVFLSLKALKEDPWKTVEKNFKKGDKINGRVLKFKPFGALIQITPEIQGLIHISEFGSQKKMEETLEVGKKYDFKISLIDPKEHKMILELAA
jgi:small subunit ribosomal protein S1